MTIYSPYTLFHFLSPQNTRTQPSKGIAIEIDNEIKSIMIITQQWNNEHRLMIRDLVAKCLIEI